MKKFVGYVNGKEYSSSDEFMDAVNKALESGESPMMISSYYKEYNSESDGCMGCTEHKQVEDKKKILDLDTIILNESSMRDDNGSYLVPSNMKEIFDGASNKGEIEKKLESLISKSKKYYTDSEDEIRKFEQLLKEATDDKNDANNKIEYYTKLLSILNGDEGCEEVDLNANNNKKKPFESDFTNKNDKVYDTIIGVLNGFDKYLNDIGFWKK